ncbi:hypothetical protein CTI12_AA552180 [Artemisia annua]|uniref:Uncharacterized protein n=1 Tax=Artemisia annua TaxID=35608 RepID=A0A2U1KXD3_ARTAN|nr:hypothetical protein CTI12_AA552180 [Artemisia annua]
MFVVYTVCCSIGYFVQLECTKHIEFMNEVTYVTISLLLHDIGQTDDAEQKSLSTSITLRCYVNHGLGIIKLRTQTYLVLKLPGYKKQTKIFGNFDCCSAQKNNIVTAVKSFRMSSKSCLFHYDEWDKYERSRQEIHANRFLHPDIVAAYDYIYIWDEVHKSKKDLKMVIYDEDGIFSRAGIQKAAGFPVPFFCSCKNIASSQCKYNW